MDQVINLRLLEPGMVIALADGATAEVTSNPQDGVWVFVRYLSAPQDSFQVTIAFQQGSFETGGRNTRRMLSGMTRK